MHIPARTETGKQRVRSPASTVAAIAAVLLFAWFGTFVRTGHIGVLETGVFRLLNNLPNAVRPLLVGVMQFGSYAAIIVIAAALLVWWRPRLARDVFIAGNLAYFATTGAKLLYARARPPGLLLDVIVRDKFSAGTFGFPSGHAAVAGALVTILAPYIPRRFRLWWWLLLPLVMIARMYVGAHLPLDVIGGALIGIAAGALAHIIFGIEDRSRNVPYITSRLRSNFASIQSVTPLASDARASLPYVVTMHGKGRRFVKVSSRVNITADQLFRIFRWLAYTHTESTSPYATNQQKVEHEALMLMMAKRSGTQVPEFLEFWQDRETDIAFLFQQYVAGRSLDALPQAAIRPKVLDQVFVQTARLHATKLAHRDLRPANLLLTASSGIYIIDFGYAESSASPHQIILDNVELIVSLSLLTDYRRVIAAFLRHHTKRQLTALLPYLQPAAVSHSTRRQLSQHHGLINTIADHIAQLSGRRQPKLESLQRITYTRVFILVAALLGIHFLLPQVGELHRSITALRSVIPGWVLVALVGSFGTYLAAAYCQTTVSTVRVPYVVMTYAQFAASFTNRFVPVNIGTVALSSRVTIRHGMPKDKAVAAATLPIAAGTVITGVLTLLAARGALLPLVGKFHVSKDVQILVVVIVLSVVIGVITLPFLRRQLLQIVRPAWKSLLTLRSPARTVKLFAGSLLISLLYVFSLWACVRAFHDSLSPVQIYAVYFAGSVIGQASPLPGGLGATEAALAAGLTVFGIPTALAIGATLLFRLVTFWLPILPGMAATAWLRRNGYLQA